MMAQTQDVYVIEERIERLERTSRRLTQAAVVAPILVGCAVLLGMASPTRTVKAEKFILRDANGKETARLEVDENDDAMLVLLDENQNPRAALVQGSTGGSIGFYENQVPRLILIGDKDVGAVLSLVSANNKGRVRLAVKEGAFLGLTDAEGKVIFTRGTEQ